MYDVNNIFFSFIFSVGRAVLPVAERRICQITRNKTFRFFPFCEKRKELECLGLDRGGKGNQVDLLFNLSYFAHENKLFSQGKQVVFMSKSSCLEMNINNIGRPTYVNRPSHLCESLNLLMCVSLAGRAEKQGRRECRGDRVRKSTSQGGGILAFPAYAQVTQGSG